jgi:hypothetical protein
VSSSPLLDDGGAGADGSGGGGKGQISRGLLVAGSVVKVASVVATESTGPMAFFTAPADAVDVILSHNSCVVMFGC